MIWMRIFVTVFVAAIFTVIIMGWGWTGANQPPAGALASRIVFTLSGIAAVIGLVAVWRSNPSGSGTPRP